MTPCIDCKMAKAAGGDCGKRCKPCRLVRVRMTSRAYRARAREARLDAFDRLASEILGTSFPTGGRAA